MTFLAEHFVTPPHWEWYILGYFFLAGISGGAYALGSMLRLWGSPRDEEAARIAFLVSLPALVLCPILLTVDLGQPLRFWHMMVDTGPATFGQLNLKAWSPMSLGVWGLLVFGIFSAVNFLEALAVSGRRYPLSEVVVSTLRGGFGTGWMIVGTVLALFIAAYTGVLLSVSNQPVWSDTWALGGLFLASGLSGAAACVVLFLRGRAAGSASKLAEADAYFVILEVVLLAVFLLTVAIAGTVGRLFWPIGVVLWLIVLLGLALPLAGHYKVGGLQRISPLATAVVVLLGVLALRAAVIFGPQT